MKERSSPAEKLSRRNRGISVVVGYITNTAIILIAVTLSVTLTQGAVDNFTNRAAGDEIESVGQSLAEQIESADTLIQRGSAYGDTNITQEIELPESENGYSANITYNSADGGLITVSSVRSSTRVKFSNDTPIEGAGSGIGLTDFSSPVIEYNSSSGEMVIE